MIAVPASCSASEYGSGPLLPLNSRIVYIGDSITQLAGANGFPDMANVIAGGRYYTPNGYNLGVSGNTSTQILARISSALALNPAVLVVEGGVNDPTADYATTISNLSSIYQQAIAAGARVVALTILPAPGNIEDHVNVNNYIRTFPYGITVANNTPGFNNATMTYDGLHPSLLGALFVGNNVAACIGSLISPASIFTVTAGQLSPNPTMSGSITPPAVGSNVIGTGIIPTGFELYENGTSYTSSMVGTQDIASNGSNEQILTLTNGSGGVADVVFALPDITVDGNTGDLFEAWSEMDIVQSNGLQALQVEFANSIIYPISQTVASMLPVNGVYRTMPVALGSSLSTSSWTATFSLAANATCQVKIHDLLVRKVPSGQ